VGVFLQLWLTPMFGLTGAAAALSIGYAAALAMYVVMFCRRSGVPVIALLPTIGDVAFYQALARQLISVRR
jgi:O-antigen/teichoic acid export membrane protein